jgi:hypothetical protein
VKYPRLGTYGTIAENPHEPAMVERLARFDFVSMDKPPVTIQQIHDHNPECIISFEWLPLMVRAKENPGFLWSLQNYITEVAYENNWILRDVNGDPVGTWGWVWLNWTRHCPKDSEGLTAAEWIARRALPAFAQEGFQGWEPWGRGSRHYNAITFEVFPERLWEHWIGQAISMLNDGRQTPLDEVNNEFERTTRNFLSEVRSQFPSIPLIFGGDAFCPSPELADGLKQEDAFWRNDWDWEDEFHGQETMQRGYELAHNRCLSHSRYTLIEHRWHPPEEDPESEAQRVRFLLGTACILDGFYMRNIVDLSGTGDTDTRGAPQHLHPKWYPEYDIYLGRFGAPYQRQDALYVRAFYNSATAWQRDPWSWTGLVRVNPSDSWSHGVPPQDAIFQVRDTDWKAEWLHIFNTAPGDLQKVMWMEKALYHVPPLKLKELVEGHPGWNT